MSLIGPWFQFVLSPVIEQWTLPARNSGMTLKHRWHLHSNVIFHTLDLNNSLTYKLSSLSSFLSKFSSCLPGLPLSIQSLRYQLICLFLLHLKKKKAFYDLQQHRRFEKTSSFQHMLIFTTYIVSANTCSFPQQHSKPLKLLDAELSFARVRKLTCLWLR